MVFQEGVMELLHCWQDAKLGEKSEKYLDDGLLSLLLNRKGEKV